MKKMEDVYAKLSTPGCVKEGYLFKKSSSKMLQVGCWGMCLILSKATDALTTFFVHVELFGWLGRGFGGYVPGSLSVPCCCCEVYLEWFCSRCLIFFAVG